MSRLRYFVKAHISGWHEVSCQQFCDFVRHIREHSTPPKLTKDTLIAQRTFIVKMKEGK